MARLSDEVRLGRASKDVQALFALLPDDLSAVGFHAERRAMAEVVARVIQQQRIPRVVLLSASTAALGEQGGNGFGADLAYFERLVCATDAAVTVLRASYFQDNVAQAIPVAERLGAYHCFTPSVDVKFPTIATADVGAIAARALLAPQHPRHEVVDLVGPSYSQSDMARHLGEAVGKHLALVRVPPAEREGVFRQWMSPEAARAMVETLECIASPRLNPRGERVERGQTRLQEVLQAALVGPALTQEVQP